MKFATKPYDSTHLTIGMLLHYLGRAAPPLDNIRVIVIQIFCIYSADMEENVNKLHFNRL